MSTGEFVRKNAPEFCQVSVVHEGKKVVFDEKLDSPQKPPHSGRSTGIFKWTRMLSRQVHFAPTNFVKELIYAGGIHYNINI